MNEHHEAWLRAHPDRSRTWFLTRLAEGFEVHHLDSDPTNNRPENLVLLEERDHKRVHSLHMARERTEREAEAAVLGRLIYEARVEPMMWREAYERVVGTDTPLGGCARAQHLAKLYADRAGRPWPPLIPVDFRKMHPGMPKGGWPEQ